MDIELVNSLAYLCFAVVAIVLGVWFYERHRQQQPGDATEPRLRHFQGLRKEEIDQTVQEMANKGVMESAIHQAERAPVVLAQTELEQDVAHKARLAHEDSAIAQSNMNTKVFKEAERKGISAEAHNQLAVAKGMVDINVDEYGQKKQIDVEVHREQKKVDVEAYIAETQADLKAALAERLIGHQTVLMLQGQFEDLIKQRWFIVNDKAMADDLKQALLEAKDKAIKAFGEDLHEQMARNLLSAPKPETLEGNDTPNEGTGSN